MDLIELAKSAGVEGFLHCNELERLVTLSAGKDVLEVGSFKGLSAWGMSIAARWVDCVDTFCANDAGQVQMEKTTTLPAFQDAIEKRRNVMWFQKTSEQAEKDLNGSWDFIFLDAMHTYEDVAKDIERWWPRVKPGGCMAFHDYGHHNFPGVKQAVDEKFGPPAEGDVTITLRVVCKS